MIPTLTIRNKAPRDPFWASVQLLLKMDNLGSPFAFIDSSLAARSVTQGNVAPNRAEQSSADFQFGPAAGNFSATPDWLIVPHDASLAVGSSDFTMECWAKFTYSGTAPWVIYAKRPLTTPPFFDSLVMYVTGDGAFGCLGGPFKSPANWEVQILTSPGVVPSNTWTHLAYQRSGNRFSAFVNGTEVANATYTGAINDVGSNVTIGVGATDGSFPYPGLLDEFRFTIGAARYTWPTYTVPVDPFPTA